MHNSRGRQKCFWKSHLLCFHRSGKLANTCRWWTWSITCGWLGKFGVENEAKIIKGGLPFEGKIMTWKGHKLLNISCDQSSNCLCSQAYFFKWVTICREREHWLDFNVAMQHIIWDVSGNVRVRKCSGSYYRNHQSLLRFYRLTPRRVPSRFIKVLFRAFTESDLLLPVPVWAH